MELVQQLAVAEAAVVADGVTPGQRGAENLAAVLVAYCPVVRIITPPAGIKDAERRRRRRAGLQATGRGLAHAARVG
jgi:hypothetical protein